MRRKIEQEVGRNPGISFSELKESLGMANGQLQYHLRKAEVEKKDGGYVKKEVCQACELKGLCDSNCIKGVLRDGKKAEILRILRNDRPKNEIAEEIGIDPSTLSYHLNVLEKENLLEDGRVRSEIEKLL